MPKQKHLFARDGHLNDEGVALYVDALKMERRAELPPETRMHVAQCQRCRKEITGLFALLSDADYSGVVSHPFFDGGGGGKQRGVRMLLRAAATVGLVIGGALVVYYISTGPDTPGTKQLAEGRITQSDRATSEVNRVSPADTGEVLVADNFAELPEYEDVVKGELRGASLQLVSPGVGDVVTDPVVFRWSPEIRTRVYLEILNNREEIVHRGEVRDLPYVLQRPLPPGLYYWKLVGEEELILVGKFLVKEKGG